MIFWILVLAIVFVPIVYSVVTGDSRAYFPILVVSVMVSCILTLITLFIAGATGTYMPRSDTVEKLVPLTSRDGVEGFVLLGESNRETTANFKVAGNGVLGEDFRTFKMIEVRIHESPETKDASVRVVEKDLYVPWALPWKFGVMREVTINVPVGGIGTL